MEGPLRPEDHREYTIKIIPHQGQTIHSIRLPLRVFKYGFASLAAGAVLFVGAFGYATYSAFEGKTNAAEISQLQQVNSMQQEQLSQLAKKSNALQDEMEKLSQIEQELQRLSGLPASEDASGGTPLEGVPAPEGALPADTPSAESAHAEPEPFAPADDAPHDGQGGPWIAPNVKNVRQALDNIQQRIAKSRANLEEIRAALVEKQQYMLYQQQLSRMTPSGWPAGGDVSSPYGLRWGGSDFHPGIDIANDYGTPITATADGIVVAAGWNSGGYGNMVDIDHGNGVVTRYGHAQEVVVSPGQTVTRGQIIAFMGSTGFSTGPHVHYEVRINGEPVNPSGYL